MQMAEEWLKTWICLSFLFAWARAARPRFDVSTDMGMVLVPADAEVDTAIFRLRATDQDADFPLIFEIIATTSPIVRVENLPCTLYNKVCQANVILTRRLVPGRLHDFVVRVRDSKGDVNSMQATISVTNSTTPRDKIFPHLPSLIMVPEDTKPEKELDYLLVESNPWSGKPVYIELWQPKELFKIRQRQMGSQTKGIITLIGELDFETQSMYTLTMYATDPYTEPGKDTRNIAGVHVVVVVKDVQDVPPVFTLAPPLTKINNTVKPGDVILRVHAEDGDKGVPREVTYGLVSEGNPFTPFFNVSETTGEIILARPLEELTKITHVGAPIVLKIVAEEIRTMRDEPPAQASIVELGLLLGEPGNSPPYFENDNYVAWMDENAEPGTVVIFSEAYSTRVKDEDIGKAGVFALKLENNNGTFEINPTVAERTANFVITVRDNSFIDYEKYKSLRFKIVAQEVGPATNLSTSVPVTIFLRDTNDNLPVFDMPVYEVTLSENANAGTRVVQVHATDKDAGIFGRIQYTRIIGDGSEAFEINPDSGLITVSMGSILDREQTSKLELTVEAKDEEGRGLRGIATIIINILDINDNAPTFEKPIYEFLLNSELTNFTMPAFIKAVDADAESPNNVVRYEIVHGNYDNKFELNEETGELMLLEAINKVRRTRQNQGGNQIVNLRKQFRSLSSNTLKNETNNIETTNTTLSSFNDFHLLDNLTKTDIDLKNQSRTRRAEDSPLFILTARAYDLGVPHLSSIAQIRIMRPMSAFARIVMFVMPGENPDPTKTAETLATITGSRVVIQEIRPYIPQIDYGSGSDSGKRSVVVARVEHNGPGTLVDVDKIRESLAANGFGIISGMDGVTGENPSMPGTVNTPSVSNSGKNSSKNVTIGGSSTEEVTVYKAENKLLTWLLALLGLLLIAAIIALILCCICPSCPFYMEPRKRRIHSSETLVVRSDGRPKRHLQRKPIKVIDGYAAERKEAWSADPGRQNWQFNRRNTKNLGIASLPGDVLPCHQKPENERVPRAASLRLHDGNPPEPGIFGERVLMQPRLIPDDERIYMEDMEAQHRSYEQAELDSLRRHELERGSDSALRNGPLTNADARERVREQHYYRDGNAEVLRLVTRGDIEDRKDIVDRARDQYHANGKDILLQRFIEDQKLRRSQDLRDSFQESIHEADVDRIMEAHQRMNEPTEIIILPERLEFQRQPSYNQRHQQDHLVNVNIQRIIADRNYKMKNMKDDDDDEYRSRSLKASLREAEAGIGESGKSTDNASERNRNVSYGVHDVELVRQNALLTRLLLEKETRSLNVPLVDSSSFLETQSLPGQVAIATQTDRTTATQTEFFGRSRSDNEELEEDPRIRRKSKLKGRFETKEDFKKMKTIWVRTPIPEESRAQSGNKKSTPTRTKIEVSESRKVSISPDVLKEISNSLKSGDSDENDEDEEYEIINKNAGIKSDKKQKSHKVTSKTICTSKKKIKETRVNSDSTTPSPETKEKAAIIKGTIQRKKTEKPIRVKKLGKSIDSEKNHFMEPSFRVLEREINNFQQKIREFGDKKFKLLIKDDSNKKEKASEDDDKTMYDITKRCEVTRKQIKKSFSRESSPTKITVEKRIKSSEEDSCSAGKTNLIQEQQNISSSDLEEFEKSKWQPLNFNESIVQHESSKTQTRSRSKLRRQTHLDSSNKKSSSDKSEKLEDSECKTEKSKDSSSSAELKITSNSSSSNDKARRSQPDEKKTMQCQKTTSKVKPTGMSNIKQRITSLKSKTIGTATKQMPKKDEKLDKSKSLAQDNKVPSPSSQKDILDVKSSASAEENLRGEINSSTHKDMMKIDLDELAKDVRDVVEKEISSLTQAAKDVIKSNKSDLFITDKKDETLRSPSKSMKPYEHKQQSHMKDFSKRDINKTKNGDGDKMNVDKKQKSKVTESTSPTKPQSDEAISFIVIENNGNHLKLTNSSKKNQENTKKPNETDKVTSKKSQSKESLSNTESKTDNSGIKVKNNTKTTNRDKEIIVDKVKTVDNVISDKEKEMKTNVCDNIVKSKESISNEIHNKVKENISETSEENKKNVPNTIDNKKTDISRKANETKANVSDKMENLLCDKIDENKTEVSNEIKASEKIVSDKINKIEDNTKKLSKRIDNIQADASDKIHSTEEVISGKIKETISNVTNKADEAKDFVTSKVEKIDTTVTNVLNETKDYVSDKIEKIKDSLVKSSENLKPESNVNNKPTVNSTEKIEVDESLNTDVRKETPTANAGTDINPVLLGEIDKNSIGTCKDADQGKVNNVKESETKLNTTELSNNEDKLTSKIEDSNKELSDVPNILDKAVKVKSNKENEIIKLNNETESTVESKEHDNKDSKFSLPKSISSSLPKETIDKEDKEINKTEGQVNQKQLTSESATTSLIKTEIGNTGQNETFENIAKSSLQQEQVEEKSISALNGLSKEKDITEEKMQIEKKKKTETNKDFLNKEDSLKDLNKETVKSLGETTQLKQMKEAEIHREQQTEKKECSSSSKTDKTQETTIEVSQLKQTQGQANIASVPSQNNGNIEKVISTSNENKGKSSPLMTENKEIKSPVILLSQVDDIKGSICKITDATSNEEEETDDDSSTISDISNKTALRTQPYSTPRHSISSDGGIDATETPKPEKTSSDVKSSGKAKQKWNLETEEDPLLKMEAEQQPKPTTISENKAPLEQSKTKKSSVEEHHVISTLTNSTEHEEIKPLQDSERKERTESSGSRATVVAVKKKEHLRTDQFTRHTESRKSSPRREKPEPKSVDKKLQQTQSCEQRKVEIRSKHLKLHVSHHYRPPKEERSPKEDKNGGKSSDTSVIPSSMRDGESRSPASRIIDYGKDPEIENARSRYMAWYQQKRAEMEKKRRERKESEEEHQRPRWLKRAAATGKSRKAKSAEDADQRLDDSKCTKSRERAKSSSEAGRSTTRGGARIHRLRIRPLVNVESEQLKAIVRQGRRLRRAEGVRDEDTPVQIFAPEKPLRQYGEEDTLAMTLQLEPRHHLTQHSEYKYEKAVPPMPFYLHPPPVPHPSPEHFQDDSSDSRRLDDDLDSGIAVSLQGGTRLRHQQLLEKKSVFDIAYSEAAPTQLRSDSSTPPS